MNEFNEEILKREFDVGEIEPGLKSSFNIAPLSNIPVVVENPIRRIMSMRWGLIPSWAKDESIGAKLLNARAETITEKPSFRRAFQCRRCLVIAGGYYEWRREGEKKIPVYFHLRDQKPMGFAGLWEEWTNPQGRQLNTCTIIAISAAKEIAHIHHRMPVIIPKENRNLWLNASVSDPALLTPILQSYSGPDLEYYDVTNKMNNPRFDSAECITKIS